MNKRVIHAWCLYDWANSAFATTVMAALFPPFYRALAAAGGLSGARATAGWGYTAAIALLAVAAGAPLLGAAADYTGRRKRLMACFVATGVLATLCMAALRPGAWVLASLVFIAANVGFAGANVFYESFLPSIAGSAEIDRVSSRGYALGYLGGGMLLVINALWLMRPGWFGLAGRDAAVRASFVSVAVWWACFSIPFFRRVPETAAARAPGGRNPVAEGWARLVSTFRHIARYRQLLLFLVAFWIYNDGISTIIKMATAYGDEIGIGLPHMVAALIVTQFVGIPFTMLFGRLAGKIGAKRSLFLALGVYTLISLLGFFMRTPAHFFALAFLVGTVQGGSQALSRSLFASMVPKDKASEFFGFFSTSGKLAGILGPLLFALVSHFTGRSRLGIACLVAFFVLGGLLLRFVDEEQGRRAALTACA